MTLEKKVGGVSDGPENGEDGTKWLEDIFKKYFVPSYSYLGHGTSKRCADSIMKEGLYARCDDLLSTTIPLCDCRSPAMRECIDKILNWPHRNYENVVIVAIPNPRDKKKSGFHYFNSVFEELEDNNKINQGIGGIDRGYKIPTEFIVGYVDVKNKCFVENPKYDSNRVVDFKTIPECTRGRYKGTTPSAPHENTIPEIF